MAGLWLGLIPSRVVSVSLLDLLNSPREFLRTECDQWKVAILESIIESPLPARRFRPLPAQSSLDETQPIPKLSLTSGGDSSEQEEVFKAGEQGLALRLDVPLNPSPRVSTTCLCLSLPALPLLPSLPSLPSLPPPSLPFLPFPPKL